MQIVFRVDASYEIGSGHVMRCLALAEALRERNAKIEFICRAHTGHLIELIEQKGFQAHPLFQANKNFSNLDDSLPKHASWLGIDWQVDAEQVLGILSKRDYKVDWLILDHYGLDYRWEERIHTAVEKLMVIDDLADRNHVCDLLLDQNYSDHSDRYNNLVPRSCIKLQGPRYALLRKEFFEYRDNSPHYKKTKPRLFISFGGSDNSNETGKTLEAIKTIESGKLEVDLVIGANFLHRQQIEEAAEGMPNVKTHCQISNMAELMSQADLVVGAGGVTMWERSCLGKPSLVITVAENQIPSTCDLAKKGYILWLGNSQDVTSEMIATHIECLLSNSALLNAFSAKAYGLTDGQGIERVVNRLLVRDIRFRKAELDDCQSIYNWRNHEEVRKHSIDSSVIAWENHIKWYDAVMMREDRVLLIAEIKEEPVGVVRFDIEDQTAEVSIYLVPGNFGFGIGTELLKKSRNWIKENLEGISRLEARILPENSRSRQAFINAGFREEIMKLCFEFH